MKRDVSDRYFESEGARLLGEVRRDNAPPLQPPAAVEIWTSRGAAARPSQATTLLELATDWEFFHTAEHEPFVIVDTGGHREVWPAGGAVFRRWLRRLYYEQTSRAVSAQAVQDALGVLEAKALYDGPKENVHVRLAGHDRAVYLDLGDEEWQAVEITAEGWRVVSDPPVWFRRPNGLLPLPAPEHGGQLDELRRFVNITDEHWLLLVTFLVFCLHPVGPYPLLVLHGEPGSAKSTTARVLRDLIDPYKAPIAAPPRNPHDLAISAQKRWLLAYDNLSSLPDWLSDAFCRLATGGGFTARKLYTDAGEIIFDAQRPIVLTGVGIAAARSDLLDRSLLAAAPLMSGEQRQREKVFWPAFREAQPQLLGALLDALSTALRRLPEVELSSLPRMADFAHFGVAVEPALALPAGAFLAAYAGNRAEAHESALDASPIAGPLREIADEGFDGTASELMNRLTALAGDKVRPKEWPANASQLSRELGRLAQNLRHVGVEIEFIRTGSRRRIVIRKGTENAVTSVN